MTPNRSLPLDDDNVVPGWKTDICLAAGTRGCAIAEIQGDVHQRRVSEARSDVHSGRPAFSKPSRRCSASAGYL